MGRLETAGVGRKSERRFALYVELLDFHFTGRVFDSNFLKLPFYL